MTSSGTWVGPGECTNRMPGMRGVDGEKRFMPSLRIGERRLQFKTDCGTLL
jgi:hypothetical protein